MLKLPSLKRFRNKTGAVPTPAPNQEAPRPSLVVIDRSKPDLPSALGIPEERVDELQKLFNRAINDCFDEAKLRGDDEVDTLELMDKIAPLAATTGELVLLIYNLDIAVEQKANPYIRAALQLQRQEEENKK